MTTKVLVCFVVVLLATSVGSQGHPTPGHLQAARQYFSLYLERSGGIDTATKVAVTTVEGYIHNVNLADADKERLRQVLRRVFREAFEGPEFQEAGAKVIAKYYSEPEILELLRYARTPLGDKSLRLAPILSEEFSELGKAIGDSPDLQRRLVDELRRELPHLK